MNQTHTHQNIHGHAVPRFFYGTAWKEDATAGLTQNALQAGFRAIDTANQRKHYFEAGAGAGIAAALQTLGLERKDLFIQTKYTYQRGQDHRLPYDPKASHAVQVQQSFASSLQHLNTTYLDSYVLHGPYKNEGVHAIDWEVWRAMEALHAQGKVRFLGVSNIAHEQLQTLWDGAQVKPTFVQNRCYANRGWDRQVRALCKTHGMHYQGFSLLTANRPVLADAAIETIATRHGATPAQVIFAFAMAVGMIPLTGTSNTQHMLQDLDAMALKLTPQDIHTIETCAG